MKASTNRKSTVDEGSLDQYLRDISVFPLINREKEVELAKLIRQKDQEALDTLVRSNLRFVVSVRRKKPDPGRVRYDLINEGPRPHSRRAQVDETKGTRSSPSRVVVRHRFSRLAASRPSCRAANRAGTCTALVSGRAPLQDGAPADQSRDREAWTSARRSRKPMISAGDLSLMRR